MAVDVFINELRNAGFQPHQIAGIVGRLQQESGPGIDPTIMGDNGSAFGAAQWRGPRLDQLKQFAGDKYTDPAMQAKFLVNELSGSESRAGGMLRNAKNVDEAARAAMAYERPAGFSWDDPTQGHGWAATMANANNILGKIGGDQSGTLMAAAQTAIPQNGTPSLTLNSVPASVSPTGASPQQAPTNPLDDPRLKGLGKGADMIAQGLNGGGGKPDESLTRIDPTSIGQSVGAQQQGIAQAASQLMANRKKRGMTLGMGMMG